jgi:hypothetical protein
MIVYCFLLIIIMLCYQLDKDNKTFIFFYLTEVATCGPLKGLDAAIKVNTESFWEFGRVGDVHTSPLRVA